MESQQTSRKDGQVRRSYVRSHVERPERTFERDLPMLHMKREFYERAWNAKKIAATLRRFLVKITLQDYKKGYYVYLMYVQLISHLAYLIIQVTPDLSFSYVANLKYLYDKRMND